MKGKLLLTYILFTNVCFSQEPNPLDFFPHHLGDIFEYQTASGFFQNIITKDSLGEDGKYYIDTKYYGPWAIDTYFGKIRIDTLTSELHNRQWGGAEYSALLFKLKADSGDTWQIFDTITSGYAQVVNVFQSQVLGEQTVVKSFEYFTKDSLFTRSFYIASKFGIIAEYQDPPFDPVYFLRGAKIGGVVYGTLTSIEDNFIHLPDSYILSQNYPNPFNPSTLIKYALPHDGFVSLKVYDIIGNEVASLVDEVKPAGNYNVKFKGYNLASGVYIYRLKVQSQKGGFIGAKKMVLAK